MESTVNFSVGADDATYALPATALKIKKVKLDGKSLEPITLEESDKFGSTGKSGYYYVWANEITLVPTPTQGGTNNLKVWYTRKPAALTLTTDIPEVPETYHEDIVRFALARAKELDEENAAAANLMAEFDVRILESRSEATGKQTETYPSVSLVSGDD